MKNIFKFFSIALAASVMMFTACTDPVDNPDNPDTPTTYTVTVNSNDATLGTVSVSPNKTEYEAGDVVTITATPASNANFLYWNGTITDNPYTFTVSENVTYTATFEAKPQPSYAVTFDGTALDVSGFSEAQYQDQNGTHIFYFQCAKQRVPAEQPGYYNVTFPYFINVLYGTSTTDMAIYSTELYKDTYYTAGENKYGDWQLYRNGNHSVNCTALDLTTFTMTVTMSAEMYSLTDVVDNGASTDGSDATHKMIAMTLTNMTFPPISKGGFKKFNVVK